jgi:ligand-binding sensor domain-containing protein
LWAGTEGGGLIRYKDESFSVFGANEGLTNDFIRAFCEDRDGRIRIGMDGGLSRFSSGAFRNARTRREAGRRVPSQSIRNIA